MKWQAIAMALMALVTTSVLTLTYTDLLSNLFEIDGVSYTISEDQVCMDECVSYVNVTTSYWTVCFEHTKPDQVVFYSPSPNKPLVKTIASNASFVLYKKTSSSRTLWVNLNNVSRFVTANPYMEVDVFLPATGNKWRPLKDGDCWAVGKVNRMKLNGSISAIRRDVEWGIGQGSDEVPLKKGTFPYGYVRPYHNPWGNLSFEERTR